jgi:hypothetical protein
MPILGGGGTTRRLGRIEARDAGWKLHTRMHGDGVDGRHMNRRGAVGGFLDDWLVGCKNYEGPGWSLYISLYMVSPMPITIPIPIPILGLSKRMGGGP